MYQKEVPNLEWYTAKSDDRALAPRCPFATVETCPRYYQSLSLLGRTGSTCITEKEDQRLLAQWQDSDLWPRTEEQATSIAGPRGDPSIFSNFCPEVLFERFGYFATSLSRHSDEIDLNHAHRMLSAARAPADHPGWRWKSLLPQHFTECPNYAVLLFRSTFSQPKQFKSWWR